MSTLTGILICIGLILLVLLILRGLKGPAYSLDSLKRPIEALVNQGLNGGFLIIRISYSKKFIQLVKYINEENDYWIELAFPRVKWSEQFFKKLEGICIDEKTPYSIEKGRGKDPIDFLHINYDSDSKKAYESVKKILIQVFGVDNKTKIFVRLENAYLK